MAQHTLARVQEHIREFIFCKISLANNSSYIDPQNDRRCSAEQIAASIRIGRHHDIALFREDVGMKTALK